MQKELKNVRLSELKGFDGNPRHNNKSAQMVAKSIKEFGYINPIVVDETYTILAGNTRFKALNLLGYEEAEVLVVSGLTTAQKNGFVIADNRAGEYSKWNVTALERMLDGMEVDEKLLKEFGILNVSQTKKELEKLVHGEKGVPVYSTDPEYKDTLVLRKPLTKEAQDALEEKREKDRVVRKSMLKKTKDALNDVDFSDVLDPTNADSKGEI